MAGLPAVTGFASPAAAGPGARTGLNDLALDTTAHVRAAGLYRWPSRWDGGWSHAGPDALAPTASVALQTVSRTIVGKYGVAGFGMSIVEGALTEPDGTKTPLYGFAEVLAAGPLMRALARDGARSPDPRP